MDDETKWLIPLEKKTNNLLKLYCFPYAGGSANIFRRWPLFVPQGVHVVPVELPGHGKRLMEPPHNDLLELVEQMAVDFGGALESPFAFYGHSMGALLAFELTKLLRKYDMPLPVHLFVSAHLAPHKSSDREPIYNLPETEFVDRLLELEGTSAEVLNNKELRELFLPVLRSDFQVCETYKFKDRLTLDIPITAFCGEEDKDVTYDGIEAWREHTMAAFELRTSPGGHFFIQTEEEKFHYLLHQDLLRVLTMLKAEKSL